MNIFTRLDKYKKYIYIYIKKGFSLAMLKCVENVSPKLLGSVNISVELGVNDIVCIFVCR